MRDTRDHYINCMARWLIDDYKTKDERHAVLSKVEEQHGKEFADDLRKRVMVVWNERGT